MQSVSKYNEGIKYLFCAIDLLSKYAWVVPLKDKKGLVLLIHFKKYPGSEFYNNSFQDFLKINNIEMFSAYNK